MLGIAYLLVYLAGGCLIIRSLLPGKRAPVRLWLGLTLGILLMMWLPALLAFAFRFSVKAHLLALIPLCGLTLRSDETETYLVQEDHLRFYHRLCLMVEDALFDV